MKERVYAYLKTIPAGKVTTYGRIAEYLGNKNYAIFKKHSGIVGA